jgi:hypothetical protein
VPLQAPKVDREDFWEQPHTEWKDGHGASPSPRAEETLMAESA